MSENDFDPAYFKNHLPRFEKTLAFMQDVVSTHDQILDLGPVNPFSRWLGEKGYQIENTPANIDLDLDYQQVITKSYDVITAFEIFEHLVSPFPLLHQVKARKLIASVPLKLWFTNAYWNDKDPFDRHYHEFESRQFDMLLDKAGWQIEKTEKWISKSNKIGIRPLLRYFIPRYYIVYATRKSV